MSSRCPFTVGDSAVIRDLEAHVLVALGELVEALQWSLSTSAAVMVWPCCPMSTHTLALLYIVQPFLVDRVPA